MLVFTFLTGLVAISANASVQSYSCDGSYGVHSFDIDQTATTILVNGKALQKNIKGRSVYFGWEVGFVTPPYEQPSKWFVIEGVGSVFCRGSGSSEL